jgi:hypothetical protein
MGRRKIRGTITLALAVAGLAIWAAMAIGEAGRPRPGSGQPGWAPAAGEYFGPTAEELIEVYRQRGFYSPPDVVESYD